MSQHSIECRLVTMEPINFSYTQRLTATQRRTLLGALSLNFSTLIRATVSTHAPSWQRIGDPWPEPSRIEWEDTQ